MHALTQDEARTRARPSLQGVSYGIMAHTHTHTHTHTQIRTLKTRHELEPTMQERPTKNSNSPHHTNYLTRAHTHVDTHRHRQSGGRARADAYTNKHTHPIKPPHSHIAAVTPCLARSPSHAPNISHPLLRQPAFAALPTAAALPSACHSVADTSAQRSHLLLLLLLLFLRL